MFETIVVGIDGQPGGEDAIALATALASEDTRLIAVHAFPYEIQASRGSVTGYEEEMREEATALLATWVPGSRFERRVIADVSPGRALHFVADEVEADVVVVGACHRGRPGRVLLGDVSRAVVHGSRRPVAVAPRDFRLDSRPISTIGVGFVDSPEAKAAVDVAVALAKECGADLKLRTVVPPEVPYSDAGAYASDWKSVQTSRRQAAREGLEAVAGTLPVESSIEAIDGLPGVSLVEMSAGVDLMVVGSRGWGALKVILLGSCGDRLTHDSRCPVIVVPRPAGIGTAAKRAEAGAASAGGPR